MYPFQIADKMGFSPQNPDLCTEKTGKNPGKTTSNIMKYNEEL